MRSLVVIPTYQEASNIENVLRRIRESAPETSVLVVDDSSPDKTAEIAQKLSEDLGNIEVLERKGKQGLGSAYRAGFAWGASNGYDVMVEMDADLSHDPAVVPRLLQLIEDGADMVVGSRYVPGGAIPGWPAHRALLSRWGNIYARTLLNLGINDATSGFRAYSADLLQKIDLEAIRADGYGFQIEMVYRAARERAVIRETPITFIDRTEGESKMSGRIIFEALGLVTLWAVRDRLKLVRSTIDRRRGHNS